MSIDFSRNNLDRETSPYLLQHQDNPVHWQAWSQAALDAARRQNKPILLSVGYAACHWCHVMAHESFENEAIAALMNDMFINIKVDREERPDIDTIYQSALQLLNQQGGWPLTMFLTPEGRPFWGGTYFPPVPRHGSPSFPAILERVKEVWDTDQGTIEANVTGISNALNEISVIKKADHQPDITPDLLDQMADQLMRLIDEERGGIGGAPKFPNVPVLEMIWRRYLRDGSANAAHAVLNSLTQMAQGGIYDHLGGGFARYSVDDMWLVPHFEKMLYDNSALMLLMTDVWRQTGNWLMKQRVAETADWVCREMIAEGGGFAATLDADSEGVEGKFYVWAPDEVLDVLGPDADLFMAIYDVSEHGNFEGSNILNRLNSLSRLTDEEEEHLSICRQKLLDRRAGRIRPGWDDKVLADWNGMMITAMVDAGMTFGRADWVDAARRAYDFIVTNMKTEDGRLHHSFRRGEARHTGTLDDHAAMIRGALAIYEATADRAALDQAREWAALTGQKFMHSDSGSCFLTATDAEALIVRTLSLADNATPNGNGIMMDNLIRLHRATGEDVYRQWLDKLAATFAGQATKNFYPLATGLNAIGGDMIPTDVVIIGPAGEDRQGMAETVWASADINRWLIEVGLTETVPKSHPAYGKALLDGKVTAYVCHNRSCSLPLTKPEDVIAELRRVAGGGTENAGTA